jgi:ketosteroid isomerase-like protein
MRTSVKIAILLAGVVAAYLVYRSCSKEDEAAIREIIQEMAAAAEARDAQKFMEHFSSHYQDSQGHNAFILFQIVQNIFGQLDELKVRVEDVSVVVAGDQAYVTLAVVAGGRRQGQMVYPFGREDSPEHPRITFQKESFGWKIVRVEGVEHAGY